MTDESDDARARDPLDPFGSDGADSQRRDERDVDGDGSDDAPELGDGRRPPIADSDGSADGGPGRDPRDAPLDDLANSVRERRDRPGDVDSDLFEERDVDEIDTDVVWERLEDDGPELDSDADERVVRVVEKADYCEGCPYFSPPPAVHCTHDGTEILELVDMDSFRVAGCPVVRKDERLEEL